MERWAYIFLLLALVGDGVLQAGIRADSFALRWAGVAIMLGGMLYAVVASGFLDTIRYLMKKD